MTRRRRLFSFAVPTREPRRVRAKSARWARLAVLSASVWALPAAASEPVRFEYSAPAGCPSQAIFEGRVRERSLHQRAAVPGELGRSFVVTVSVDATGATARVDFVDPDGSSVSRSVRGATCDEVVSGIALVTALAIDARAGAEAPPPAPSASAPAPSPTPAQPRAPAAAVPAESESSLKFFAGLGAGYQSYAGPQGALSLDVFVAASFGEAGPVARASLFHLRADVTDGEREGRLRTYGVRLEGCPLSLRLAPAFVEPCLGTGIGALFSSGIQSAALPSPDDAVQLWWDAVLILRAGLVIDDFFVIEAQGELGVPFSTPGFGFDGEQVFEVPRVGGSARGGLGFRFP